MVSDSCPSCRACRACPLFQSVWVLSSNLSQASSQRCDTNLLCTDETIVRSKSRRTFSYSKTRLPFCWTNCIFQSYSDWNLFAFVTLYLLSLPDSDKCSTSFPGYDYMKSNTQFGSTCVYGLNHVLSYSQAKAYCEDNGLKLVQLQDPQKQKKVFEATGYCPFCF